MKRRIETVRGEALRKRAPYLGFSRGEVKEADALEVWQEDGEGSLQYRLVRDGETVAVRTHEGWGFRTWLRVYLVMTLLMVASVFLPQPFLVVAVSLQMGALMMVGMRAWQGRVWRDYLEQCRGESRSQTGGSILAGVCKSLFMVLGALTMSAVPPAAAVFAVRVARDLPQAPSAAEAVRLLLGVAFFSLGCLVLTGLVLFLWWEAARKIRSYFRRGDG